MAKKVALVNMKGGVGKSTLAAQLAWQFSAMKKWLKKVLVIDMDPQFNVSQYLLGTSRYKTVMDNNEPTIWDIFEQYTQTPWGGKKSVNLKKSIQNVTEFEGGSKIDLVPSRLELAFSLRNPAQKESLPAKFVSNLESKYDLILIDCPPTESLLTTAAYLTSDYILVPVKPEFLSTIGLPLLVNSLDEFHSHYEDHKVELMGIMFNATTNYAPEEILSKQEVRNLAQQYGWYVFKNEVTYSRSYPKSAREGKPIFWTSYVRQYQATIFHNFAEEFAGRIGL
jgi:chromosome partitioning protein